MSDTVNQPPKGYDLRLMSALNDVSDMPTEGKNLISVAAVNHVLHFRIFDGDGEMVVDTDEKRLTEKARQIEDLRKQLERLWPPHELTKSEKGPIITAVTSIVDHAPPKPPMWSERLFDVRNTARGDFWEGSAMRTCRLLGISYAMIALGALVGFSLSPFKKVAELQWCMRLIVIVIGIIVSAGQPAFFWIEARAFDWWLNQKFPNVEDEKQKAKQKQYRETYKLNADNGKAFWAGILAVYAAVLLKG